MAGTLAKASLAQLTKDLKSIFPQTVVKVQFNPDSLKVSLSNQLQQPNGAGSQTGTAAVQYVGAGTMKMSAQLWFDAAAEGIDDVRTRTRQIRFFIKPQTQQQLTQLATSNLNMYEPPPPSSDSTTSGGGAGGGNGGGGQPQQLLPPLVSFTWGSFRFDGIMDSLEESLEFFSPDGKALRASVTFSLVQQQIQFFPGENGSANKAGNKPFTTTPQGMTFQGLAASAGMGSNWQAIASANGIENPRQLATGQLIDSNAGGPSAGASIGVTAGVALGANDSGGAVAGASASSSASINVGFNVG